MSRDEQRRGGAPSLFPHADDPPERPRPGSARGSCQGSGHGAGQRSGRFARVALERGIDHPDGLTYAIPTTLASLAPGDRVVAPLGAGNHPESGIVLDVDVAPDIDPGRIKPIRERTGPPLPADLIDLARWIARYHCCPIGMALATVAPAAVKRGVGRVRREVIEPSGAEPAVRLPPATAAAWDLFRALPSEVFPAEPKALAARLGLPSIAPLTRLEKLGLVRRRVVHRVRAPWSEFATEASAPPTPSADQAAAVASIGAALGGFAPFLLYGVTGSGKTEVYLRAIDEVLGRGGSAIVLVPEIALTPQTAGRFIGRFGAERVAVLHSGLTASQRNLQWTRVAEGKARVVVGARSAVFAPVDAAAAPLGLIVIDEEHDPSYKQDSLPRYHARNVALKRAQLVGCPVVLGSATPSLESWHAARRGRVGLLRLPERLGGGRLPEVEVVDLADERRARDDSSQRIHSLGPRLERMLRRTLDEGAQAMLLLNRRGYANYIHAPSSGWVLTCDHCDATMVFHKAPRLAGGGVVRCHHCLHEQRLPEACPESGEKLSLFGAGSQRLEEELARKYPELVMGETMLRLDSDSMRKATDYFDALERFRRGEVRVLVGTQMIAKGLDFPNVRLIGVVNADTALHLPDFRAAERTFQLVAQVAGRAGRSEASAGARVIVQTWNPGEPSLRHAASHDYTGFADMELTLRERSGLPPATRMARIVCRDEDYNTAMRAATALHRALMEVGDPSMRLRPPAPCAITRIAGQHRIAVDVLAPASSVIQAGLTELRNRGLLKADAHTAIDVDPVALL